MGFVIVLATMGLVTMLAWEDTFAAAHETKKPVSGATMTPGMTLGRLVMPDMDPLNGGKLFVDKGCIACHAINAVGGHDAPAMDAHEMDPKMNPFEFTAKMWNHAPGMIAAQEEALGEMITLSGAELADIIAFVHHDAAQHGFSERNLTPAARRMMEHEHGGMPAPKSHSEEIGHAEGDNHGPDQTK
jgi:hypothetical protein